MARDLDEPNNRISTTKTKCWIWLWKWDNGSKWALLFKWKDKEITCDAIDNNGVIHVRRYENRPCDISNNSNDWAIEMLVTKDSDEHLLSQEEVKEAIKQLSVNGTKYIPGYSSQYCMQVLANDLEIKIPKSAVDNVKPMSVGASIISFVDTHRKILFTGVIFILIAKFILMCITPVNQDIPFDVAQNYDRILSMFDNVKIEKSVFMEDRKCDSDDKTVIQEANREITNSSEGKKWILLWFSYELLAFTVMGATITLMILGVTTGVAFLLDDNEIKINLPKDVAIAIVVTLGSISLLIFSNDWVDLYSFRALLLRTFLGALSVPISILVIQVVESSLIRYGITETSNEDVKVVLFIFVLFINLLGVSKGWIMLQLIYELLRLAVMSAVLVFIIIGIISILDKNDIKIKHKEDAIFGSTIVLLFLYLLLFVKGWFIQHLLYELLLIALMGAVITFMIIGFESVLEMNNIKIPLRKEFIIGVLLACGTAFLMGNTEGCILLQLLYDLLFSIPLGIMILPIIAWVNSKLNFDNIINIVKCKLEHPSS